MANCSMSVFVLENPAVRSRGKVIRYSLYVIRQRVNGGRMRERLDRREKRERIPSLETQLSFVFPVSCQLSAVSL